ncbi:MAG TPA: DUF488 family protein [Polyangia bacterium]|nr:DUF488 family protein [Polyangia bacterium]
MGAPIRTKRWNDPVEPDDGFRLLICRIRPRGVPAAKETWSDWWAELGPSRALLDAFHGKHGPPIAWEAYVARYLEEMRGAQQLWRIRDLGRRAAAGEVLTLLCSSACHDPAHCHRTLLARLIEAAARGGPRRA